MRLPNSRCSLFRNVPPRKAAFSRERTLVDCPSCSNQRTVDDCCQKCYYINMAKRRYEESNIPLMYWDLKMSRDFWGDPFLLEKYQEIVDNLENILNKGTSYCFAGKHGVGKTFAVTSILKKAADKGKYCLYTTLSDIVAITISAPGPEKILAQRELVSVEFLVIDEFDPRHMVSGASANLHGRQLEYVFRRRAEETLPTFMCTNSPQVLDSFEGEIRQSIASLMNYVEIIPVLGKDARNPKNKGEK